MRMNRPCTSAHLSPTLRDPVFPYVGTRAQHSAKPTCRFVLCIRERVMGGYIKAKEHMAGPMFHPLPRGHALPFNAIKSALVAETRGTVINITIFIPAQRIAWTRKGYISRAYNHYGNKRPRNATRKWSRGKTGKLCELIFPPRDTVVAARNRYKEARSTNY